MFGGWDVMILINLALCIVILALGCLGYVRDTKNKTPFNIGVAFGLFGVSHLIALFGLESDFEITVILTRVFGYLIVVFTLYNIEFK